MQAGGVISYPTDTVYGLGCDFTQKKAIERLYQLKELPKNHHSTFLCSDLSQISAIAVVSNSAFRLLKRLLPGPYVFILEASRNVPNVLQNKRRTVGVRIPKHEVPLALVQLLGHPMITTSAVNEQGEPTGDPDEVEEKYKNGLDILLDGGSFWAEPSTVLSLVGDSIEVVRMGKGPVEDIL